MILQLDVIASRLAGLEETLIYKLLDRAQFAENRGAYTQDESGFRPAESGSLFDLRLRFQEMLDTQFGRYLIPEERPFHDDLCAPRRIPPQGETGLVIDDLDTVNVAGPIREAYLELLPALCPPGDDGQWGSSVEHDVICLQALGRRIHYGALYVGESKFREDTARFEKMVRHRDDKGLMAAITRAEVEERVLARVRSKVEAIQSVSDPALRRLANPDTVVDFFRSAIIPLTKAGEIRYLYQRVGV